MRQMTCCSSLTWLKLLVDLFSKLLARRDSETPASRSGESHPEENRCKVWATIFGINAGPTSRGDVELSLEHIRGSHLILTNP
jgi:hypothetical protein